MLLTQPARIGTDTTHLCGYGRWMNVWTRLQRIAALNRERAHPRLIRAELDELLREAERSGELAPKDGRDRAQGDARLFGGGLASRQPLEQETGEQERARDPPPRPLDREP
jgi:hypothetical protein